MAEARDTDAIEISGFDDTDVIVLEAAIPYDDTLDLDDTDRVTLPRARTQPDWPPPPPLPQTRSRRHKAVYAVVTRAQTSSDGAH